MKITLSTILFIMACVYVSAPASVPGDSVLMPRPGAIAVVAERPEPEPIVLDRGYVNTTLEGKSTVSIYALPYSLTGTSHDWRRLWINTGVLAGAFVGTLVVLEALPEDATSWNRAEIQKDPPAKRWYENAIKKGPCWDGDNPIFNYVLHPYAGAVYFMGARSNGFNFYQSMLYSACISTIGWEYGIEACMERPSIQDLIITPLVGSVIGEMFYRVKRSIVNNDYELFGSKVVGNVVAVLIDPLNEVVGFIGGNPARKVAKAHLNLSPSVTPEYTGFTLRATF